MKNIISVIVAILLWLAGSASAQEHFLEIIKAEQNQKSIALGETIPGVVVNEDKDVKVGRKLNVGDRVFVPKDVRVTFESSNRNIIETKSNAEFFVSNITNKGEAYYQFFGKIRYSVIPKAVEFFNVAHTKYLAAVEGTVFEINVDLENKEIECTAEQGTFNVTYEYKVKIGDKEVNGLKDINTLNNQEGKKIFKSKLNIEQSSKEFKNYEEALFFFTEQLKTIERLGETSQVLLTKNNIGLIYHAFSYDNEAVAILEGAEQQAIKLKNELDMLIILNNISMILSLQHRYDEVMEYCLNTFLICREIFGEFHPYTIINYKYLISAQISQAKSIALISSAEIKKYIASIQEAALLQGYAGINSHPIEQEIIDYQKPLIIDEKRIEDGHTNIATDYRYLGELWYSKGQYTKVIEYYQKALSIDEKVYGKQHPNIAIDYSNIGSAWYSNGDYDKAIYSYQKALIIDEKNFGQRHPKIAIRYNNLGCAWAEKGNYNKIIGYSDAMSYFKKALKISIKFLGENHQNTKTIRENIEITKHKMKYKK